MMLQDDAIQATNDDAASCKRSAVQLGYWKDDYIQYFSKAFERKPPEINRGYYARVHGIQSLVKQFLQTTKCQCQFVNLGAGFDTQFWNLSDEGSLPSVLVEVDFENVTCRKALCIKSRKQLLDRLTTSEREAEIKKCEVHSARYHLVPGDLRAVDDLSGKLKACGLDWTTPTVFIAECVLVYMPSAASSALVKWIADTFKTAFFINYEQVNMGDRFGEVMISNLKSRGCGLAGVEHCQNLASQCARFSGSGWHGANAINMMTVYKNIPTVDLKRIERLEFLDEQEMLQQLCEHYCISWAYIDGVGVGLDTLTLAPIDTEASVSDLTHDARSH